MWWIGWRRDGAQVLPIVVAVVFVTLVLAAGVVRVAGTATTNARASGVADAVALTAAAEGSAAARRMAHLNDAVLISIVRDGDEVEVTVELAGRRASARAVRVR